MPRSQVADTLRHLYERAELRVWTWLPRRMRRRLTTYGLGELSDRLSLPRQQDPEASLRQLLEALAEVDREERPRFSRHESPSRQSR